MFQIANLLLEYKTVILSFLPYAAQRLGYENVGDSEAQFFNLL